VTDDVEHLVARLRGASDAALALYRAHEARFTADVRAMSPLSERLLAGVDYAAVAAARRANFAHAHEELGDANRLTPSLGAHDVPLCYPFWPRQTVAHQQLWDLGIFAPRLWPEVTNRRLPGFAFERQLASELLPLPIDQRYDTADMQDMCGRVGTLL
jgi:hypothetical protein